MTEKKIAVLIAVIAVLTLANAGSTFSGGGLAGNVQIIEDAREGTIILQSDRWKSWCVRSSAICAANILFLALLWFIPKKTEPDIILAYIISGASFVLAIWVCLSGMLLARWKILPSAAAFVAGGGLIWACWKMLEMLKSLDRAFSTGRTEALRNLDKVPKEDKRLAVISGAGGDWPDTDFLRETGAKPLA